MSTENEEWRDTLMKRTPKEAVTVTDLTTGRVDIIVLLTIVRVAIARIVRDLILIVKGVTVRNVLMEIVPMVTVRNVQIIIVKEVTVRIVPDLTQIVKVGIVRTVPDLILTMKEVTARSAPTVIALMVTVRSVLIIIREVAIARIAHAIIITMKVANALMATVRNVLIIIAKEEIARIVRVLIMVEKVVRKGLRVHSNVAPRIITPMLNIARRNR